MNVSTLIDQVDLVEYAEKFTTLTESGNTYRGICPICGHGNPTEFCVYEHKTFHCWVCGKSGDVVHLIRYIKGVDFYTALEELAEELNVDLTKDPRYEKRKAIVNGYEKKAVECRKNLKAVKDYLYKRGLTDETINFFELGADSYGNVYIPFIDENGRYVGGATRRFDGNPKYINNKNDDVFTKAEFLFNLRGAKDLLNNELYMVEGYFCAMSLHQNKMPCVSYNSAQPTKQHFVRLQKLHKVYKEMTVVLVPDNDGVAYPLLSKVRKNANNYAPDVPIEVLLLPDGVKDVNDFFVEHNLDEFKELPRESLDLMVLKMSLSKCSSKTAERQIASEFIKSVKNDLVILDLANFLSKRWDIDLKVVQDFLQVSKIDVRLTEDFKDPETCLNETVKMLSEKTAEYGITTLDAGVRGGGRKKDVTFIGGYSSSGKTFVSMQMCMDMVVRQGLNVLFFSMEMSAGALYERIIANLLGKPTEIVDKMLIEGDSLAYQVLDKLKSKLYVVDKNGLSIEQVDAYIKDANVKLFEGNLNVVFIDYLQYMKGCSSYEMMAETAKGMKPLAKDNGVHVVVLSQLNRNNRIWEKPNMADLKGGGDLEASADNIFLIWRPGANPQLIPEEAEHLRNVIMLGIGKARNGSRIEEIKLVLDDKTSRIKAV